MEDIKLKFGMPSNYLESGLNLLYFGDFHYQEKAPGKRIDDFHATEFRKAELIQELARKHNVRAYLQGGDFLDKPRISDPFMQKILANWNFKQSVKNRENYDNGVITKEEYAERQLQQIPMIGIVGNHEVFGGSIRNYGRTSIKTLADMGFMNLVGRKASYTFTMANGKTVSISGQPYDLQLLNSPDNFMMKQKHGDVDIFMVHEALYDTELGEGMSWMPISKVSKGTYADMTIAAHIHNGFGWVERDGKIFGNPGAPAQQSTSAKELDRDVVVTLIHVSEDCQIYIEDIKLDTPRSREIFDLTASDEEREQEEQMERVREIIDSVEKVGSNTAIEIIDQIGKTEGVNKRILELATSTTEEVMEASGANTTIDPNVDYRVTKIILENFESHLYSEIDLPDDNLPTVLIGESSHGKSSILRAIYWVLENEGSAMDFIRRAKDVESASVTLVRADGLRVKRFVSKRHKRDKTWTVKENGYEITTTSGQVYETNTQGVEQVRALFGLTYLMLDQKDKLAINFQKQEDPWFFIGLTSQQRAKVIGSVYGTQYILGGIKSLESKRRALESERKVVTEDIASLDEQLKPLADIDSKSRLIENASRSFAKLESGTVRAKTLSTSVEALTTASSDKELVDTFVTAAGDRNKISTALSDYESKGRTVLTLTEFISAKGVLDAEQATLEHQVNLKGQITDGVTLVGELQYLADREQVLAHYITVLEKGERLISNHTPVVESRKDAEDVAKMVSRLGVASKSVTALTAFIADEEVVSRERNRLNNLVTSDRATIDTCLVKLGELGRKRVELQEQVDSIESTREAQDAGQKFLTEQKELQDEIHALINQRQGELKFNHQLKIGSMTLYGVQTVKIGEQYVDDKKLQDYKARLQEVNNKVIRAETRLVEIKRRQDEAEKRIRDLGVDPANAKDELAKLQDEITTLEQDIEEKLSTIEKVAQEMEV